MTWHILLAFLVLLSSASAELIPNPLNTRGAEVNNTHRLIITGPPFYYYWRILNVTIQYPENTTYYTPTLTTNITVLEEDGSASTRSNCSYKLNNGGYNDMTCAGGNCSNSITYPNQYNTLTVNCSRNGYSGSDTLGLTLIYYNPEQRTGENHLLAPIILTLIGLGIILSECRNRDRRRDAQCRRRK